MDAPAPALELTTFIGAGDLRQAGEWLVRHYAGDVVSLCRSMVRERDLADDLAQDVFANAFSSLRGYRAEASPRTWLLSIARNRCIDHLRRANREPWREAGEDTREPDAHPDEAPLPAELLLRREDVESALAELAEGERALVVLRFRHGLEYPELASVFGLREGTVRMRLSRALGKMRLELERLDAGRVEPEPALAAPARARAVVSSVSAPAQAGELPPPAPAMAARSSTAAAPRAAAPAPASGFAGPPPPPAFGGPPPASPPAARPPAPSAPSAPKGGLWQSVRRYFARDVSAAAPSPLGLALRESEPSPSDRLLDGLARLVAGLPGAP